MHESKQADTLNVVLVAKSKIKRGLYREKLRIMLSFTICHQYQCGGEPKLQPGEEVLHSATSNEQACMTPPAQLRQIRESLGVTQETVARRTRIGLRTYIRAEGGGRVTHGTATQILNAINELLAEAGRGPVTLDDLGLNLY